MPTELPHNAAIDIIRATVNRAEQWSESIAPAAHVPTDGGVGSDRLNLKGR